MKTQVNIKTNTSLLVIIILINTLSVPHTGNKGVGLFNPCTESYPIQMITIRTQTTCTHTRPLTHTHITGILIGGQSKKYCLLPGLTVQHNEYKALQCAFLSTIQSVERTSCISCTSVTSLMLSSHVSDMTVSFTMLSVVMHGQIWCTHTVLYLQLNCSVSGGRTSL